MTVNTCVVCGRPTPDGWACVTETERARQQLAEITDLTEAARATARRQVSHGPAVRGGKPGPTIPIDLAAQARIDVVQNALIGWARIICEERGIEYPTPLGKANS